MANEVVIRWFAVCPCGFSCPPHHCGGETVGTLAPLTRCKLCPPYGAFAAPARLAAPRRRASHSIPARRAPARSGNVTMESSQRVEIGDAAHAARQLLSPSRRTGPPPTTSGGGVPLVFECTIILLLETPTATYCHTTSSCVRLDCQGTRHHEGKFSITSRPNWKKQFGWRKKRV
jgi:hypothetical protein